VQWNRGSSLEIRGWWVKISLTKRQEVHLLRNGGRSTLFTVRSIQSTENAMANKIHLIARLAQALLAVTATVASVLVFQLA
jgi:hypothetical protein